MFDNNHNPSWELPPRGKRWLVWLAIAAVVIAVGGWLLTAASFKSPIAAPPLALKERLEMLRNEIAAAIRSGDPT